ncbi:hypothetical protein, partial [Burkholderia cepacia]|uniref:hypothetical protein n=1 Tax=Burkholderia cepacia TaxID=292 RepID=UPI001E4FD864
MEVLQALPSMTADAAVPAPYLTTAKCESYAASYAALLRLDTGFRMLTLCAPWQMHREYRCCVIGPRLN